MPRKKKTEVEPETSAPQASEDSTPEEQGNTAAEPVEETPEGEKPSEEEVRREKMRSAAIGRLGAQRAAREERIKGRAARKKAETERATVPPLTTTLRTTLDFGDDAPIDLELEIPVEVFGPDVRIAAQLFYATKAARQVRAAVRARLRQG